MSITHRLAPSRSAYEDSEAGSLEPLGPGDHRLLEITLAGMIEAGQYTFRVSLNTTEHATNRGVKVDENLSLRRLSLTWDPETVPAPFLEIFGLPAVARFKAVDEAP